MKPSHWTRSQVYALNRSLVIIVVFGTMGTLLLQPSHWWEWGLDYLLRSYLIFVGCTMAHESGHFHLGATARANRWWGRLATLPSTVPALNFRKTHGMHHAYTNIPDKDPDYFLKPNHLWEVPFRSLGLPHWWFLWLYRHGKIKRRDWMELFLSYLVSIVLFGAIIERMGVARVAWGVLPALATNSIFLWYFFAVKTHDGYLTSSEEEKSHNYYGHLIYWLSIGLSMHRVHHTQPQLGWIEILPYVEQKPSEIPLGFGFPRHIIRHADKSSIS